MLIEPGTWPVPKAALGRTSSSDAPSVPSLRTLRGASALGRGRPARGAAPSRFISTSSGK